MPDPAGRGVRCPSGRAGRHDQPRPLRRPGASIFPRSRHRSRARPISAHHDRSAAPRQSTIMSTGACPRSSRQHHVIPALFAAPTHIGESDGNDLTRDNTRPAAAPPFDPPSARPLLPISPPGFPALARPGSRAATPPVPTPPETQRSAAHYRPRKNPTRMPVGGRAKRRYDDRRHQRPMRRPSRPGMA